MKKTLSIICIFVVALMLTACGSKGLSGTYKLVEVEANGQKMTSEDIKNYGMSMELTIKDDKNATLKSDDSEVALTYDDKQFTGKDQETGEMTSIPYTVSGNTLTLTEDGEKLIFKK